MRNVSQRASNTIPAAQYLRMSNEAQQYSMDNQKAAIQEYATCHGFTIIKTYADAGKSGVIAKYRAALRELLKDVLSGNAEYKAILVYDVSRWADILITMKPRTMNFCAPVLEYRCTIVPSHLQMTARHPVQF